MEKQDKIGRITLQNPCALVQEEALPALALNETLLNWTYLSFNQPCISTLTDLQQQFKNDSLRLYASVDNRDVYQDIQYPYNMFISGVIEDGWYHV